MREAVRGRFSDITNLPQWAMEVCCILTLFLSALPTGENFPTFSNYRLQLELKSPHRAKCSPYLLLGLGSCAGFDWGRVNFPHSGWFRIFAGHGADNIEMV